MMGSLSAGCVTGEKERRRRITVGGRVGLCFFGVLPDDSERPMKKDPRLRFRKTFMTLDSPPNRGVAGKLVEMVLSEKSHFMKENAPPSIACVTQRYLVSHIGYYCSTVPPLSPTSSYEGHLFTPH
eukprot:9476961-Pyramimonas_sp.AAC.2